MPATTTSRLRLEKPDGTTDNVDVGVINANMDRLDTLMSFSVVTSATYPASGYKGQAFYETDTGDAYVNIGESGSAVSLKQLAIAGSHYDQSFLVNGSVTASGGYFDSWRASAASPTFGAQVTGDTYPRIRIDADGDMTWGSGSATGDTTLYRSAADTLATDDSLTVGGNLTVSGSGSVGNLTVTGDLTIGSAKHRNGLSSQTTLANSTTETALASMTIPANDAVVGAVYRIKAWGTLAVAAATTPTMTFRGRLGGAAGTSMAALGAVTVRSGATDGYWEVEFHLVCVATGASGTWNPNLRAQHNFLTSATTYTPLGPVGFFGTITRDTTAASDMVITGQWSAASSSNTMTCRGFAAERVA